jgi:hypothetical protein
MKQVVFAVAITGFSSGLQAGMAVLSFRTGSAWLPYNGALSALTLCLCVLLSRLLVRRIQ